eukprot:1238686-Prymnesium_polylepis.1
MAGGKRAVGQTIARLAARQAERSSARRLASLRPRSHRVRGPPIAAAGSRRRQVGAIILCLCG